jgi:predicted RNA-binding protein with TRAM domain
MIEYGTYVSLVISVVKRPFILGIKPLFLLLMNYTSGTIYGLSNYTNRSSGSKPVDTGKEYDVHVTETSRKGDGIAKIQGFVIFVKNGRIGQDVKAKVTSIGERFATAEIVV